MSRSFFALVSVLLLLASCHPLMIFRPPQIKSALHIKNSETTSRKIEFAIDSYGIPSIRSEHINDVMFGLGFMHARDRLFHLDLIRHAALGRTAELFGDRGLSYDRKLRILTYRLDDQLQALSQKEHDMLDSYVRGVNEGARHRKRSAEHFLLGVEFETFTKRDVVAIARLQSWQLGSDLFLEITRLKIARSDWSDEAKRELMSAMDDGGTPIIADASDENSKTHEDMPAYLSKTTKSSIEDSRVITPIIPVDGGASNAWVVDKTLTKDGHALLMNDPHLPHTWPSNFYLVSLYAKDFFATGASFVGLPGVVIGASKNLAWGVTASFVNTQDAVLLNVDKNDKNAYWVDGQQLQFSEWPQRYCTNKKGRCFDEINSVSIFGPVIDRNFDRWIESSDAFAVLWTGFFVEEHRDLAHNFIDLAKAENVNDALWVVKNMTLPGVNLVFADQRGDVGYAYAGLVPKRDQHQHPYLPLDGNRASSLWPGFLKQADTPSLIRPKTGYIITANQNIFAPSSSGSSFGKQGAPPLRASRIQERLSELLKNSDGVDFDELARLQLDETSIEAKELAPLLGAICVDRFKDKSRRQQIFAEEIANFDGRYSVDSYGALPYELLVQEAVVAILRSAFGKKYFAGAYYVMQANYAVKKALLKDLRAEKTTFAKPYGDVKAVIGEACDRAYVKIKDKASSNRFTWRWGRHHFIKRQSPLAKAPLIGKLFTDKKREVAGSMTSPMAESGLPVTYGANLRLKVKLTTPPSVHIVLDSGNSGTVGHQNAFDQAKLWHDGKFITMDNDFTEARKKAVVKFEVGI